MCELSIVFCSCVVSGHLDRIQVMFADESAGNPDVVRVLGKALGECTQQSVKVDGPIVEEVIHQAHRARAGDFEAVAPSFSG